MGALGWAIVGIILFALVVAVLGRVVARRHHHRPAGEAGYAENDYHSPSRASGPQGVRDDVERTDRPV